MRAEEKHDAPGRRGDSEAARTAKHPRRRQPDRAAAGARAPLVPPRPSNLLCRYPHHGASVDAGSLCALPLSHSFSGHRPSRRIPGQWDEQGPDGGVAGPMESGKWWPTYQPGMSVTRKCVPLWQRAQRTGSLYKAIDVCYCSSVVLLLVSRRLKTLRDDRRRSCEGRVLGLRKGFTRPEWVDVGDTMSGARGAHEVAHKLRNAGICQKGNLKCPSAPDLVFGLWGRLSLLTYPSGPMSAPTNSPEQGHTATSQSPRLQSSLPTRKRREAN